jgi:methylmalonyl-CoA mutase cobalamin-binding subunit
MSAHRLSQLGPCPARERPGHRQGVRLGRQLGRTGRTGRAPPPRGEAGGRRIAGIPTVTLAGLGGVVVLGGMMLMFVLNSTINGAFGVTRDISLIVMGTVKGDMHDIGKNIVRIMMESRGLKVVDLGVDISAEQFYNAAVENHADIVCCSALLTATMEEMRHVVELFNEKDYRKKVKIMIGGAPVTQRFADHIGADIYTDDAVEAARVAYDVCVNK